MRLNLSAELTRGLHNYQKYSVHHTHDWYGRALPAVPKKKFLSAHKQYEAGTNFKLFRSKEQHPFVEIVVITIIRVVDVGFSTLTQAIIARVDEGPSNLLGQNVFLKFYDPPYIHPDDLYTIRISSPEAR
jgi:hypothetical protein